MITSIDKKVTKVLDVNPHLPLPLGISTLLYETFKCSICLISPLVPPVIVSACCGHIVGCQKCTDSWYKDGDTLMKPCPLCGRERGYNNSLLLYGVNDLLLAIAGMASPSGSQPVRTPIVPAPPAALDLDSTDLSEWNLDNFCDWLCLLLSYNLLSCFITLLHLWPATIFKNNFWPLAIRRFNIKFQLHT